MKGYEPVQDEVDGGWKVVLPQVDRADLYELLTTVVWPTKEKAAEAVYFCTRITGGTYYLAEYGGGYRVCRD